MNNQADVIVAAEGPSAILLKKEFPGIVILPLPGYSVRYNKRESGFVLTMLAQFPRILLAIYREKKWLKELLKHEPVDAVISDNRFGFNNKRIPCIFITHQLRIRTGSRLFDNIIQKLHYQFISRFNGCWVPDHENLPNLSGQLSHDTPLPPVPVTYIGPLSRFHKTEKGTKYDIAILLSGPEPQRSIFENIIISQLQQVTGTAVLIRGLPGNESVLSLNLPNLTVHNHLPAIELNEVLLHAGMIIARSGYTTIMDLVVLQKKAILVPTPGQTEQEYLADYLKEKKIFYSMPQKGFSLLQALEETTRFPFADADLKGMNESYLLQWLDSVTTPGQ
jgi:hypothetical protein